MVTEERLKYFQKEFAVQEGLSLQVLMQKAGKLTAMNSAGLTTIQYSLNGSAAATPTFPLSYAANDVFVFTFAYTNLLTVTGNLILIGKDN